MVTENHLTIESVHYNRLLLAIDDDDDDSSRKALNYACTVAKPYDIPLGIVSVLETGDLNIFQSLTPEDVEAAREKMAKNLNTYVEKAREFGVQKAQPIIAEGRPAAALLDEVIPAFKPDLVIMGSHVRRGRLRLGHVASEVARDAAVSVIIVR